MFDCKEQLENCRTYINMLNVRSLKSEELHQLASILYTCKGKAQETENALGQVVDKVKGLSEDSQAFVFDQLDPIHDSLTAIQLPQVTFNQDKSQIEKEFLERRVRAVHYRKQPLKILKEYEGGMMKVLAWCADKDFPVECYQIPRYFDNFVALNQFFN